MKLSRRDFIHAGCAAGFATLAPNFLDVAKAGINNPGSAAAATPNTNRVTLNVNNTSFANMAKSFSFLTPPSIADANGYPTSTPSSSILANPTLPQGYTGDYVWKWTGEGSMDLAGTYPMIVSSSSSVGGSVPAVGDSAGGNINLTSVTTPRVQFSFALNVQSVTQSPVSNGAGGNLIRIGTKTGFTANLSTGNFFNVAGILTQTNANGNWIITVIDAQTFDLQGSTWSAGQGSSGVVGKATIIGSTAQVGVALTMHITAAGTFSGFTNLVWCQAGNEAAVTAGQIWDPTFVAQQQFLMNQASASFANRGWLRFMDQSNVQGSYESDFANRTPLTYIGYTPGNYFAPNWQTTSALGAITNGGSDAYTCADATTSVWNGSAYIDSATIQGTINAQNTTANPTLNVGGHGAKPVFDHKTNPYVFRFSSAPASAGLVLAFTISASWFNGGVAYTGFTYTTVAGDVGNLATFNGNFATAFNANATLLAAGIQVGNSGQVVAFYRTAQAGVLTITYTSGPAICTMTRIDPASLTSGLGTFIYNQILGGWIYQAGGNNVSIPFEAIVQLCNLTGSHCWYNWPCYTQAAFVTSVTQFFGDATTGLTSGLRFGTEVGNELWNSGAQPFFYCLYLGYGLGFSPNGSELQQWSWGALRTIQYANLSTTAWTGKGRNVGDHYIFQMGRSAEPGTSDNFTTNGLKGAALTTSNAVYNAFGALSGGPAIADYSVSGNRPADKYVTAAGMACYWYSNYIEQTSGQIFGLVTDNAQWLQASKDYANGLTSTAFAALANLFTLTRAGGDLQDFTSFATVFSSFETTVELFDSTRAANSLPKLGIIHYEGAPQWSFNASNLVNGTNGIGAAFYTDLQNRITALGWNVSAYTISGTNTASEIANQVVNMTQGWKSDTTATGAAANTSSYDNMIKAGYYSALVSASAGKGREVKPAQYGYQANTWGFFPVSFSIGNQYGNYNAIHEFNAGA